MPGDSERRAERQRVILEILGTGVPVESQNDLVELLQERGIAVTQSSVSRDLEDLGLYGSTAVTVWTAGTASSRRRSSSVCSSSSSRPKRPGRTPR